MFVEECSKFIFKAEFAVMSLLVANISCDLIEI